MLAQKVEDVKGPLVVGNYYWVPVFIDKFSNPDYRRVAPLINHLHNDIENGQYEPHYHVDTRFIDYNPRRANYFLTHSTVDDWYFYKRVYPHEHPGFKLEYYYLPCYSNTVSTRTGTHLISKSKLKHKCIHKGKCPHRGYDLSQVQPVKGIITCPLHSLEFKADTGELITIL